MRTLRYVSPVDLDEVRAGLLAALAGGDAVCVTAEPVGPVDVPDDIALVVLTSGSTARPKRVALTADAIRASIRATAERIGTGNWVLTLPLDYVAGIMVVCRASESGGMLVDARSPSFDPTVFAQKMNDPGDGRWFTSLVPTQLDRLVHAADADPRVATSLARFDRILVGGQRTGEGTLDRARFLGWRVSTTYGSAETAGGIVYDGRPIGDARIRLDEGRIMLASSSLASGYLDDANLTAESFVTDEFGRRWWRTNDLGEFDGITLRVTGRTDDVIVSGGVKVALGDIDRVLASADIDAVAGWFPDDEWGQVPGLVGASTLDLGSVRDLIERELGKAARPYRLVRVHAIPRLPSGKVDRRRIQELLAHADT